MSSVPICPECRHPVPDGLAGLCPHCLWSDSMAVAEGGEIVPGHILGEELARGGMGIVYQARQLSPERMVAVKMLRPHLLEQPVMRDRFRQEAQAAAGLQHPGILPVYQVGGTEEMPWFTMMLAEGGTLLARKADYAGHWRKTAELIAGLARAVGHAHDFGILHRDLKPGNILFDAAGRAYVCDFGLAKVATAGETTPDWTLSVQLLGTPHYMSPEIAGGTLKQATTAGDIYALGVMLYELLAGHLPYDAENVPALLRKIADEEPSSLGARRGRNGTHKRNGTDGSTGRHATNSSHSPHVSHTAPTPFVPPPADLAAIAMKCLEKRPAARYASANALADDLQAWLAGKPVTARRLTRPQKFGRWVRRNPAVAGLAALLAVSLFSGGILLTARNSSLAQSLAETRRLERMAEDNYTDSLLNLARLRRVSGELGQRSESIALLQQAAGRGGDAAEIRKEASVALATPDLSIVHRWPVTIDTQPVFSRSFALWIARGSMFTEQNPLLDNMDPGVVVRRVADQQIVARIPPRGEGRCRWAAFGGERWLGVTWHDGSGELFDLQNDRAVLTWSAEKGDRFVVFGVPASGVFILLGKLLRQADMASDAENGLPPATAPLLLIRPVGGGPDVPLEGSDSASVAALSPDDTRVLARTREGLAIWDASTGKQITSRTVKTTQGLSWSPDGKWIATSLSTVNHEGTVLHSRTLETAGVMRSGGHDMQMTGFGAGGTFLFSSCAPDMSLRLRDWRTGEELLRAPASWQMAQFSPDDRLLAWMSANNEAAVAEILPRPWFREIAPRTDVVGYCQDLHLHPDDTVLYTRTRSQTFGWSLDPETIPMRITVPAGDMDIRMFLSPDASHGYFSRMGAGTWRMPSGRSVWGSLLLTGRPPEPEVMPVPPECHQLGFAGKDWMIGLKDHALEAWPEGDASRARRYFGPALAPNDVFAPDGAWAARALRRGTTVTVHNDHGELRHTLPGAWSQLLVSHDGRWLLGSGAFGFRVWDTRSWQPAFDVPQATSDHLFAISGFSRDGTTLALRTADDTITLVALPTGRKLRELVMPRHVFIRGVALTTNARKVYVLSAGTRVHCWDLDLLDAELTRLGLPAAP